MSPLTSDLWPPHPSSAAALSTVTLGGSQGVTRVEVRGIGGLEGSGGSLCGGDTQQGSPPLGESGVPQGSGNCGGQEGSGGGSRGSEVQGASGEGLEGKPKDPRAPWAHPGPSSRALPAPLRAAALWGGGSQLGPGTPEPSVPTNPSGSLRTTQRPHRPLCVSPALSVSPPGDSRCSRFWRNPSLRSCAFSSSCAMA